MGKKHKKHHKHDRSGTEGGERPLKLVLKVGGNADSRFTSKAIVLPPAETSIRSSVTSTSVHRDAAFRGERLCESFVPQSKVSSLSLQVGDADITKRKKKKKKKHRHTDEGDIHQTAVPSYRPEEQEQLARLYHHPPVSEVHRPMAMGNVHPSGGEHRHHHKHRKHHHHDRLDRKQRLMDHVSAGTSVATYGLDEYVTPMVSSGHGLKMSFKRDVSITKSFEPPTKKAMMGFAPAIPPGFFIDPTIPARVTRSQDVPGFEDRNRLDRVKDKELKKLLLRFLNALQRKDVHQFFARPVNDKIAPGYSTVIKYPMDFQRIRLKVDRSDYRSVDEFKDDLELICTNCTAYNAPDTVYYTAAVKLLEYGIKLMKDSLTPSRRNMPAHLSASLQMSQSSVAGLLGPTDEDFIDVDNVDDDSGASLLSERSKRYGLVDCVNGSSPDQEGIGEQVMEQTAKAARTVADKLEDQCPNSKIGFLSTDASGATSLRVLNPDRDKENVPVRGVDLRSLVGPVRNGTSKLADVKEDTKDLVIPVSYLFYGPFTSFAPSYDSSRANLTKEESDLLLSSYTDATGVQFAHSLQKFVEAAGPAAKRVVDSILESATDGKHSIVRAKQKEQLKEEDNKRKSNEQMVCSDKVGVAPEGTESSSKKKEAESLQSLADEGIDVSFLDGDTNEMSVQSRLDENARRLIDLHEAQNQRLAKVYDSLESFSSQLPGQSELETNLALQVAKELNRLSAQVRPGDVVPSEGIQQILKQGMEVGKSDNEAGTHSDTKKGTSLLQELGLDDDDYDDNHDNIGEVMQSDDIIQPETLGLQKDASSRATEMNSNIEQSVKELDSEDFSIATLLDKFTGDNSDL